MFLSLLFKFQFSKGKLNICHTFEQLSGRLFWQLFITTCQTNAQKEELSKRSSSGLFKSVSVHRKGMVMSALVCVCSASQTDGECGTYVLSVGYLSAVGLPLTTANSAQVTVSVPRGAMLPPRWSRAATNAGRVTAEN